MLQQLLFREDQSKPHQDCLALGVATEITLRDVGVQRSEWDATVSRYPRCVASFANGAKHLASQYRLSTRCLPSNGWCRDPVGWVGLINPTYSRESYTVPQRSTDVLKSRTQYHSHSALAGGLTQTSPSGKVFLLSTLTLTLTISLSRAFGLEVDCP